MGRRCPLVPPRAAAAHFSAAAWRAAAARHPAPLASLLCTGRVVSLQAGESNLSTRTTSKPEEKVAACANFCCYDGMLMWLLMAVLPLHNHRHLAAVTLTLGKKLPLSFH